MKKLLVVLLALTFVVSMAVAAFAVTTSTFDGKVEWTFKNGEQFGGSTDGKLSFDLGKDFGEGYSAGLKIKIVPGDADEVVYDGDGWIKMVKDFATFTFKTTGAGGNAADELGKGYDMAGNPGMIVESTALVDGLTATLVLNDAFKADPKDAKNDGNYFNYLLKAVYAKDALKAGFGYQAHTQPSGVTNSVENDAMAIFGSYKLSDALSFGLEYASRPNLDGVDENAKLVEGSTGIRVKADYTAGNLTVNGKVQIQTGAFYNMDPDDVGSISAFDFFQYGYDLIVGKNDDPKDGTGIAGTALKIDAKYQLTDALSVGFTVEDILSGFAANTSLKANPTFNALLPENPITNPKYIVNVAGGTKLDDKQLMSYKLSATDKLTAKTTVDGWYAGYGDMTEIGLKASYNFVAGLDGSLELKSNVNAPNTDAVNSYTATIKATL